MSEVMQRARGIFKGAGFSSLDDAVFSFAMLLAKAKLSEFEEECGIFKRKYGDFEEFKRNAEGGEKESFELWDDYLAWRFAEEARKFWSQEVQGLDALATEV
ncbi:MAG: hypothetical protein GQ523_04180 [Methanophagales archaeon]|nr:hypothetical protein [Methanophagales archaeon]